MTRTIDVTGLPPEAIEAVETLVGVLRAKQPVRPPESMFDLFGSAPVLLSREEIDRQIQEERDSWGEP